MTSWCASGELSTTASHRSSTSMSVGCVKRSSTTRKTPPTCSPCAGLATSSWLRRIDMFQLNIRGRLLLSHILPVLVLVPLVGLALSYLLESQVIIPTLANAMIDQGRMVARLVQDNPQVWKEYTQAQSLVDSINFEQ